MIIFFTDTTAGRLDRDYRGVDSLTDYEVKIRYMSDNKSFDGRSQIKFHFRTAGGTERINPQMFYWAEFVLPGEFSTNGVQQVDKKAMLSNFDSNRDVYFNVDGIHATNGQDFAQFNIHRTWNSWYFQPPDNASVSVSNSTDNVAVTNAQIFNYDDMTNKTFQVDVQADTGSHLKGLEVVVQDINNGDFKTNSVSFPATYGDYVSSFSTNVVGAAGSNTVQNVETGVDEVPNHQLV